MDPRARENLKKHWIFSQQSKHQGRNNEKKFIWQWYGNSFFSLPKKNKIVILGLMGLCLEQKEIVSQALAK